MVGTSEVHVVLDEIVNTFVTQLETSLDCASRLSPVVLACCGPRIIAAVDAFVEARAGISPNSAEACSTLTVPDDSVALQPSALEAAQTTSGAILSATELFNSFPSWGRD